MCAPDNPLRERALLERAALWYLFVDSKKYSDISTAHTQNESRSARAAASHRPARETQTTYHNNTETRNHNITETQ